MKSNTDNKRMILRSITYIFLVFVALLVLIPFLWVLSNAFRPNAEIGKFNDFSWRTFVPQEFTMINFSRMFEQLNMVQIIINTLLVAFGVTLGSLFINSLTGYAFARINFKGKKIIFMIFISMMVLPIEILIISLYLTVVDLKLTDTYASLILPFLASPFGIFFMRQFFSNNPKALDEAAILDGCGHFRIFAQIYLPLAKTPLFTLGLLIFLQQWDSFIVPVTLIGDEGKMLLQVALTRLSMGLYMTDYGVLYAGVALSIVPILIIFSDLPETYRRKHRHCRNQITGQRNDYEG
jgi:ABC-type glycerol-3-phosphate transport system permease component